MCRHLAYLGPSRTLAQLMLEPSHSLLHQSYAPVDMRSGGRVNADGFGAGWYLPGVAEPVRYRRSCPLWTDDGFLGLAPTIRSGAVLGTVRSATVGTPVIETACAPFASGRWLFSHNGRLPGWPDSAIKIAAAELEMRDLLTMEAPTDSVLLWAMVRRRLARGIPPADAVAEVILATAAAIPDARLNLLVTDGRVIVASTWWHSLSVRAADGAVTVASEPTDDLPGWNAVPDRRLVVATLSTVAVTPLET